MSNLEKWINAILNEDAKNLSIGSVRRLAMIKNEMKRLQQEINELKEEKDLFALNFLVWYSHAEDAQVYKNMGKSTYDLLQLYKDRPFLRTDKPEAN